MEDKSVFIININDIVIKKTKYSYNYTFLNILSEKIYVNHIYDLLKTFDVFKLKNLYYFIYVKLINIHKHYNQIRLIKKYEYPISTEEFNIELNNYIQSNIDCILIINLILLYFFPQKKLIHM